MYKRYTFVQKIFRNMNQSEKNWLAFVTARRKLTAVNEVVDCLLLTLAKIFESDKKSYG